MSGYQQWQADRTAEECLSGDHNDCVDLAYDPDEHRAIRCMCGCHPPIVGASDDALRSGGQITVWGPGGGERFYLAEDERDRRRAATAPAPLVPIRRGDDESHIERGTE